MKKRAWTLVLWLTLALGGGQAARAQELVIDNFISDRATKETLVNGATRFRRSGDPANIVGGTRLTDFGVTPILGGGLGRSTLLDIPKTGPMILESGVKSAFRVVHYYGQVDKQGDPNPLHLNLLSAGYDRFRIEFDSCDVELNYHMQVFDGDGDYATIDGAVSTADKPAPFNVDLPFADFYSSSPGPVNWDDIDVVDVIFQTGNAAGGADFSVKRIVALPPPPPS